MARTITRESISVARARGVPRARTSRLIGTLFRDRMKKRLRGGALWAEIDQPGMGPEVLRTRLAQLRPADLAFSSGDEVLDRFRIKMLTEGSGTQIFSTTFAQWTAREALRRAQPKSFRPCRRARYRVP